MTIENKVNMIRDRKKLLDILITGLGKHEMGILFLEQAILEYMEDEKRIDDLFNKILDTMVVDSNNDDRYKIIELTNTHELNIQKIANERKNTYIPGEELSREDNE
jgi:hypothetical protein